MQPRDWLFAAALALAVFLVYQPAWQGGFVWDDDSYVLRPNLHTLQGLGRIWYDLRATQQYFPLLHSAFWLEYQLWGEWTTGYHLVAIALHCLAALLFWQVLRRLQAPGAWLAAALFALHPVHVESVAWIAELKNTFSGVLYLGAALAYLAFDRGRTMRWYALALALFALAVLSKTTTATLPAALLVIFWWKRGRLTWKGDVRPLLPFFFVGAGEGLFTAWVEFQMIGAQGSEFGSPWLERCLLASRAAWFYLGKLLWPADLIFMYPRWQVSRAIAWQYLPPLAVLATLAVLWLLRRRTRAPLAAALLFLGTLFPVAGFLNLYVFRYSLVADHFQYLPSLGVLALAAAGLTLALDRAARRLPACGPLVSLGLLAVLTVLTWRQCRMYADVELLYWTTIDRNPDCWLAHNNLGVALAHRGQGDEAIAHYKKSLQLMPDQPETYNNLGLALVDRGQIDEAIADYGKALELRPVYPKAEYNLGLALAGRGNFDEAIVHYCAALKFKQDDDAEAHYNLGLALSHRGQVNEAITQYRLALVVKPDHAQAHSNLGNALARRGQADEAIAEYRRALAIKPDLAEAHNNLGLGLAGRGQVDEAIAEYRQALAIKRDFAEAHYNFGNALTGQRKFDEALAQYRQALEIKSDYADAHYNFGSILAGCGKLDEAMAHFQQALRVASARNDKTLADVIRVRINQLQQSGAQGGSGP